LQFSTSEIKELREKTGAGFVDCKKALQETEGNLEAAVETLKERGLVIAQKKAERIVQQGIIDAYIHPGGKVGALVEVNCETDFVANTEEFKELAHNLALQITAMSPEFVSPEEVESESDIDTRAMCLLLQPYIKDTDKTVHDIIVETIAKVGENIKVRRFIRFELGD